MMKDNETFISTKRDEFNFHVIDGPICHTDDGWDFWMGDFPAVFEPFTMNWIRQFSNIEKDFLDIGAWVGPTTLFGSMFFKTVHSFEPDPIAYRHLALNVELNKLENVRLYPEAVSINTAPIPIYSYGIHGNSMSNVLHESPTFHIANARGLESILNSSETDYALIKMDIEGAESLIIPASKQILKEKKIPLILSFHITMYKNSNDFFSIVEALEEAYDTFIDETGNVIELTQLSHAFGTVLCL